MTRASLGGFRTAAVLLAALVAVTGCATGDDEAGATSTTASVSTSIDDAESESTDRSSTSSGLRATTTTSGAGQDERADDAGAGFAVTPVDWEPCDEALECATVAVPLDHDRPAGTTIDLALIRVPASGLATGSIFVNPGGPGASGVEFVQGGFRFDAATSERFHLIGFDPRGIGRSAALECRSDRSDAPLPDPSPDTVDEAAALDEDAEIVADDCARRDRLLLPHLNTFDAARDLDILRKAVGDPVLNYYGLSYGTLLGLRYAQQFPDTVGRMVLDGVVDPNLDLDELLAQQADAFEEEFPLLDGRCDESGVTCPAGGLAEAFDRVAARLEADGPIGGVGPAELVVASLLPVYSPSALQAYATALSRADGGDMASIKGLSDFFLDSISFTAYAAYTCTDSAHPTDPEAWTDFADTVTEQAPRFGALVANELRVCAFWPASADSEAVQPTTADDFAELDTTVLVVGNTGDAATPLQNAVAVSELLPNDHLVILDTLRHTAYNGSECVRVLVADYFADRFEPTTDRSECRSD